MKPATSKAAVIQMASGPNVGANLLEVERLADEAASAGARLIVLPENFAFMGMAEREILDLGEADGAGPLQEFLALLARKLGIWLVGGTVPIKAGDAGKVRAACLVFDDQGRRQARYDKIHLFDVHLVETDERYHESETIEPGSEVVVLDTPFGRLGLAVCYDLRFPELFRAMQDRGVELITLPAAFTALTGRAHWETLVRARAIENLSYFIAAAQGGFHVSGRETYGHSMIVDPWGNMLAQQPRGTGIAVAPLDREYQSATRRNFPCLAHRRLHCR
jgi:nitrilase